MENKKLTEEEIKKIKRFFDGMCKTLTTQKIHYYEWKNCFEMFETAIKANIKGIDYITLAASLNSATVILLSDKAIEEYNKKVAILKLLLEILSSKDEQNKRAGQTIDTIYKDTILLSNNNYIKSNSR